MSEPSAGNRWSRICDGFRHAFALPKDEPLTSTQTALLDRVAAMIVKRGMQSPAILAIESSRPLGGLAANSMHVIAPFLSGVLSDEEQKAIANLFQHPRAADELIERLNADHGAPADE